MCHALLLTYARKATLINAEQHFVVSDAREMEGNPFEVAERACQQAAGVAGVLFECIEGAELMARNSFMERNLQEDPAAPRAAEWDGTPEGKRFVSVKQQASDLAVALRALAKASAYDPRRPPTT